MNRRKKVSVTHTQREREREAGNEVAATVRDCSFREPREKTSARGTGIPDSHRASCVPGQGPPHHQHKILSPLSIYTYSIYPSCSYYLASMFI